MPKEKLNDAQKQELREGKILVEKRSQISAKPTFLSPLHVKLT